MLIELKDVYVRSHTDAQLLNIKDHAYYKSLKYHSKLLYENCVKRSLIQCKKKTAVWENFYKLYLKIKNEGFNCKLSPITIELRNGVYVCTHGRHRICMLRYIYNKHLELKISHGKVKRISNKDRRHND